MGMGKRSEEKLSRVFHEETGRLIAEGPGSAAGREGGWVHWYPSGECRALGAYRCGCEHGLWRYWYKNGRLAAEGRYVDGREAGFWQYWYDNGQPMAAGHYLNGLTDGRWSRRTLEGQLSCLEDWRDGTLVRRLHPVPTHG